MFVTNMAQIAPKKGNKSGKSRYNQPKAQPEREARSSTLNEKLVTSRSRYNAQRSPPLRQNLHDKRPNGGRDRLNEVPDSSRKSPVEQQAFLIDGARNSTPRADVAPQNDKYDGIVRVPNKNPNEGIIREHYDLYHGYLPRNRPSRGGHPVHPPTELQAEQSVKAKTYAWIELPANEVDPLEVPRLAVSELDDTQVWSPVSDLSPSIPNIPEYCFELDGNSPMSRIPATTALPLDSLLSAMSAPTAPPLAPHTLWSHTKDRVEVPAGYVATLRHRELLEFKGETVTPLRHFPTPAIKGVVLTEAEDEAPTTQEPLDVDPGLLTTPKVTHNVRGRRRQSISSSIRTVRLRGKRLREASIEPRDVGRRLSVLSQHEHYWLAQYERYR